MISSENPTSPRYLRFFHQKVPHHHVLPRFLAKKLQITTCARIFSSENFSSLRGLRFFRQKIPYHHVVGSFFARKSQITMWSQVFSPKNPRSRGAVAIFHEILPDHRVFWIRLAKSRAVRDLLVWVGHRVGLGPAVPVLHTRRRPNDVVRADLAALPTRITLDPGSPEALEPGRCGRSRRHRGAESPRSRAPTGRSSSPSCYVP